MNIPQAQLEIMRLWEAYQSGQISAQAYTQAINNLQISDESGTFWHVDSASQKWYRYDGTAWVESPLPTQGTVPSTPPPPPPAEVAPLPGPRSRLPLWIGLGVIGLVVVVGAVLFLSGAFKPGGPAAQLPTLTQAADVLPSPTLPQKSPSPDATLPPTPLPTIKPSATSAPSPTVTLPPKATATLAKQPTPTPPSAADFLKAQGPYLLSRDQDNVYLIQAKRSDQINTEQIVAPAALADMVAPHGGRVAFVTTNDPDGIHNLKLTIYNLAQKKAEKVIALTTDKTEPGPSAMPGDPSFEAVRSITETSASSLAWSPDGRNLAFIGVLHGPSSDLYTYHLDTDTITHLTDGPSQAYAPSWSPDGTYVLQFGVTGFGTGAGYAMAGAWAARADDTKVISLYKPSGGGESTLGWVDGNTVLVYGWSVICGSSSLRLVTIDPLKVTPLVPGCFTGVAYDRVSHAIVLSIDDITSQGPGQEPKGLYLVGLDGKLTRLASGDFGETGALSNAGAVWGYNNKGSSVAYTLAGKALSLPTNVPKDMPLVAPGGKVWAWGLGKYDVKPGLWVGAPGAGDAKQVFSAEISAAAWTASDAALAFVSAGKLYFAPAPGYKPVAAGSTFPARELVWAAP
jgi:hypothetical protein